MSGSSLTSDLRAWLRPYFAALRHECGSRRLVVSDEWEAWRDIISNRQAALIPPDATAAFLCERRLNK